ncbi:MAG: tetratricopeptide repeat protein [Bacteroidetes bacterium]|nr:tetratricopeptide repeat protein [Bacteroidota bacterium]
MKLLSILFVIFLLLPGDVMPSTEFDANCRKAYQEILSLKFKDAKTIINSELKSNPSNTLTFLLENYIDFLTVMIGEEEKDLESLRNKRDYRLQQLARGDPSSPWYLYSQADIYLQSGFARVKFGEYISAGLDIDRARRLLEDNDSKFQDFVPNKLRLGLLHSLVGTVPEKYQWAVKALNFEGTIPQGLSELRQAYKACTQFRQFDFLLPEAAFFLSFVSMNLSGDKNAILNIENEFSKPPLFQLINESPLLRYCLASMKIKTGKNDEAISLLSAYHPSSSSYPFHYLDYLLGVSKLNRLDPDANMPLLKYVAEFRGLNYIRSAYQHIAWFYFLQNNQEMYTRYMDRIKLRGNNNVDNDKQSFKDSELHIKPDPYLLKARLLFDGGYYEQALMELGKFESSDGFSNQDRRLELTYRKGRIFDEWGKKDEAIHWYDETIQNGENDPSYFAANSALHLGMIYENMHQYQKARTKYQKCLDMKFEEYNFSIQQKAKSGINRIKGL